MIKFDVTREDGKVILAITKRAKRMFEDRGVDHDALSINMDITAVHANGNPLRLAELLNADDFNFAHDVFGIYGKLDRSTGKLVDFFSPRFSA